MIKKCCIGRKEERGGKVGLVSNSFFTHFFLFCFLGT